MSVNKALDSIIENKLDNMRTHLSNAITTKAVEKLEERKLQIAQNYFGQMKEEVEQIDEISKKKLGDYVKAASHDVATKSAATGRYGDRANRVKDEVKSGNYKNYPQGKKDDETADKFFKKSWKRREGIAKATDKLTKE